MRTFEKPLLVLSACLDLQPVRYNGEIVRDEFVVKLRQYCQIIPVCPEVGIGLGVPRSKIHVYIENGDYRVFQPATGRDLTEKLLEFSHTFLESLPQVDGFLLKSKSPSCGVSNTKVYKDRDAKEFYGKGKGIFAMEVLKAYGDLPVEDEGRLHNHQIRDTFLSYIFASAHWRAYAKEAKGITDLMNFHRMYKYALLSRSPMLLKRMGNLLAQYKKDESLERIKLEYEAMFRKAFMKRAGVGSHVNTFMHILGHLSDFLTRKEKSHFLDILEKFRKGQFPISVPREMLRNWAYRFDDEYILSQTYLNPYPEELER